VTDVTDPDFADENIDVAEALANMSEDARLSYERARGRFFCFLCGMLWCVMSGYGNDKRK
jgi:hypothetical protein